MLQHRNIARRRGLVSVALQVAVALVACLAPSPAAAFGVWTEAWFVVETPHFRVHGHRSVEPLLTEIAEMCEQAHVLLVPALGYEPARRTTVIVTDATDGANGSAGVIPDNVIRVNAVAPAPDGSLGHYDNWMWNLLVHEYVHILHLSRIHGVPGTLNRLADAGLSPGQTVPRWFTEGLAVWAESTYSGSGRLDSSWFTTQLRAAFLAGEVPALGSLSGPPIDWPQATGWYLFGGHAVSALIDEVGLPAVNRLLDRMGRQLIGYRLNALAEQELGTRIDEAFWRWQAAEAGRQHAWATARTLHGLTPWQRMTTEGHRTEHLDARGSEVRWIRSDGQGPARWAGPQGDGPRVDPPGEFALLDSGAAVLSATAGSRRGTAYRDLFLVEPGNETWQRLTYGERAWAPDVRADGSEVVWVSPELGRTDLRVMERGGQPRTLLTPARWGQVSAPRFLPDAAAVVAAVHEPGGGWELEQIALADGARTALTQDGATALDPFPTADGRYVLFSSDRDGQAFELYVLRRSDGAIRQLSRGLYGVFSPVVQHAQEGLYVYATTLGPEGFDVVRYGPLDDLWAAAWPSEPSQRTWRVFERPTVAVGVAPQRVLPAARQRRPRWGILTAASTDVAQIGLRLSGTDASGANTWSTNLSWSVDEGHPFGFVSWTNRRLPVVLTVTGSRTLIPRAEALVTGSAFAPFTEDRWRLTTSTGVPFPARRGGWSVGVAYDAEWRRILEQPRRSYEPQDIEPREPDFLRSNALRFSWSWSELERWAYDFDTTGGATAATSLRVRSRALGADYESVDWTVSARTYVGLGARDRWVLALRGAGGLGAARGAGRRLFGIGGVAPHDVLVALAESTPVGTFAVRGAPVNARVGDRYALGSLELRALLATIDNGVNVLPVYAQRLTAALFVDVADAGDRRLTPADALVGVGGELRLSLTLGYYDSAALRFGVARGVGRDGITDVYALYGWPF